MFELLLYLKHMQEFLVREEWRAGTGGPSMPGSRVSMCKGPVGWKTS